jgi:hypothetical protein
MAKKTSRKHPLLLYRRSVTRYRRAALFLAVCLLGLWYPVSLSYLIWPKPPADQLLLVGGLVSLFYWLWTLIAARMAYVHLRSNHLLIQTPLFRLKISYRRIHNTQSVDLARVFPPKELRRSERNLLAPFYGQSAIALELRGWPLSPRTLRFFLSRFFFGPGKSTLILIVPDWMALSHQLASVLDQWRVTQRQGADNILDSGTLRRMSGR